MTLAALLEKARQLAAGGFLDEQLVDSLREQLLAAEAQLAMREVSIEDYERHADKQRSMLDGTAKALENLSGTRDLLNTTRHETNLLREGLFFLLAELERQVDIATNKKAKAAREEVRA